MGNKNTTIPSHYPGRPPQKPFRKWERAMLKRTFEDLSARSVSGKTIDKETFLRFFCNVPGMLGERLFFVFNTKKTGEIDFEEFTQGIALYCRGSLEQKIEFVFRMFNLKGDGRVGKSELETMLNSFVFAAETIVSGRENEQSVIWKDENHTGKQTALGFPPPLLPVPSGISSGYRAFNVLGIDEDTEGDTSDNEPPNSASSNGKTSSTSANTSRHPIKPKKPSSAPSGSNTAPAGSIFQALNAVKGLPPPNLSSSTASSAGALDPNYPFHSTLPPRRQSLPQAHSLMHSSSQPTHVTHPPGQQQANLPFSSSQAVGPQTHPHPPSTPPPSSNILHPYHTPSPFPFPSAAVGSSSASNTNKFATPTHASSGSLDFSSDDSSKRINHMVEVAMKIARKGEGRASENGSSHGHNAPALAASASVGTITPATKRVSDRQLASPADQSDHPPLIKSSSSRSTDGTSNKSTDKENKDKDKTEIGSGTATTSSSSSSDHRDSRDTRYDREPELSFYLFATWIQEFPEVLQVLDLAFAGKQQTENNYSAVTSLKDDNLLSTPPHNEKKDLSVPLDRLHNNDTHLLGNLMAQLTSSKKAKNSPHSTHPHGRNFSVTSLISPHLPSKDGHTQASSIGTDVVIDQRKEGLEVKCQQCGWEVDIRHCYACGKKVTIISESSPKHNNLQPSNPTLGGPSNNLNSSPVSGSTTLAQLHSAGPSGSSTSSSSSSSTSPSSFSLVCDKCGVLFLSGHLKYCVQCGFDMMKTGLKIEPPLVKSLSWQRKQARGHVMEGHLQKVGKTLRNIVTRWYVIRDNFMYTYSKQHDVKPSHVLFLEGCFVEAVNHEEKNAKLKFGMEIILNEEMHKSRFLYCTSASQRQQWMEAIRYHANVHSVDDYYNIGEELGVGRFSSVRVAVSKSSGKQYAIKIIDKNDIDEKEKEALRTEVAVLKLLNHPHIIKCKNVFETRKQMFIVMTFVRGGDLFDRLLRKKKFTEVMTQKIMYDLLSVVQYLHLRGIVHNDLKPENIMMATEEDDSEIIIGDFGLSKFANEQERLSMPCGTLAYVAPEVLTGTGYGKEVDLWSCGVIMYLLLSGSLPFDSHVREEIIEKTIAGRIPFPATPWHHVSDEAKSLIRGLLCVDVERRLTCAAALTHPWFRCRWNEAGERLTEGIGMGSMANMAMIGGILPPIPSLMEEPEGGAHWESSAPASPAPLPNNGNSSTNITSSTNASNATKNISTKQPSNSINSSTSTNNPSSTSNNPSNTLNPPTHLYFSSSPAGDTAVDVDSSRERDIETETEPDVEEEDSESKEEETEDVDAEDDAAGLGFRSRFINAEDDDSPAESPSHSR